MPVSKYCRACQRKHPSMIWYGIADFNYCGTSYARMFRQGWRVCHPSWSVYEDCAQESDATGARICAAVYRKDVLAIREGAVLMSSSILEPRMRMLLSLMASTYYSSGQVMLSSFVLWDWRARNQARPALLVSVGKCTVTNEANNVITLEPKRSTNPHPQ